MNILFLQSPKLQKHQKLIFMWQQMNNILQNAGQNGVNQGQPQFQSQSQQSNIGSGSGAGGKCVIFRKSGQGENSAPIMIQCNDNEKISEIVQRYRTKSGDADTSKKFIFNAKQLNLGLTVAEAGLTDNANIFVVTTRGVKGA